MLSPVTLAGTHVRLEPLPLQHLPALLEIGLDPSLWTLTVSKTRSAQDLERYVTRALEEQERGLALPFDTLRMRRVEFKASALNLRSRSALLRIGAVEERILRQHTVSEDGTIRDTVYFSILSHEWPEVRERLQRKLAIPPPGGLFSPP